MSNGIITEMQRVVEAVIGDEQQASAVVFALIVNFGGERLYIPCNNHGQRNSEIKELYNAGAPIDKLSKRYRLSERTIYRIINYCDD